MSGIGRTDGSRLITKSKSSGTAGTVRLSRISAQARQDGRSRPRVHTRCPPRSSCSSMA
ncbi:hypothetical protein [Streptomyces collinus]